MFWLTVGLPLYETYFDFRPLPALFRESIEPVNHRCVHAILHVNGGDTYDEGAEREGMFYGLFIFKNLSLSCSFLLSVCLQFSDISPLMPGVTVLSVGLGQLCCMLKYVTVIKIAHNCRVLLDVLSFPV